MTPSAARGGLRGCGGLGCGLVLAKRFAILAAIGQRLCLRLQRVLRCIGGNGCRGCRGAGGGAVGGGRHLIEIALRYRRRLRSVMADIHLRCQRFRRVAA